MPRPLTEIPSAQLSIAGGLVCPGRAWAHVAQADQTLIEVLLVAAELRGQFPAPLRRDLLLHGDHFSDSLTACQANRLNTCCSDTLDNGAMSSETASERRKRKLIDLCNTHGLQHVASESKVSAAYLDQIIKGALLPEKSDGSRSQRNVGDPLARKIEDGMGFATGWFDLSEGAGDWDAETIAVADQFQKMDAALRKRFRMLLLIAESGNERTAEEKDAAARRLQSIIDASPGPRHDTGGKSTSR